MYNAGSVSENILNVLFVRYLLVGVVHVAVGVFCLITYFNYKNYGFGNQAWIWLIIGISNLLWLPFYPIRCVGAYGVCEEG
jgi:hypothetical protein